MFNPQNLSALVGLAGAIGNNGKLESTDALVREAILSADSDEIIQKIHDERNSISPSCQFCESPCGNTSDYDLNRLEESPEKIRALKEQVWESLRKYLTDFSFEENYELPEVIYRAISCMAYDLVEASYQNLLKELKGADKL